MLPSERSGTPPILHEFGTHLRVAGLALHQEIGAAIVKEGFNAGRWPVLLHLKYSSGPVRQTDLAKAVAADRVTLGAILYEAEAEGYITREYDANDRRVKLIGLTEKGRRRAEEVEAVIETVYSRISNRVSPEEAKLCARVLREICAAIRD